MKRTLRCLGLLLALSASLSIVLHSAHMDAGHLKSAANHQCGLCKTNVSPNPQKVTVKAPVFVELSPLIVADPCILSAGLLTNEDPRGPPSLA